jgi:hypothetical protein
MIRNIFLPAFIAILPISAAASCGPRDAAERALREVYGETVQSHGIDGAGRLIEIWGNVETGSFTITLTTPDMILCLLSDGIGFEVLAEPQGERM